MAGGPKIINKYLAAALLAAPFAVTTSAQAADVVFMEPTPVIPLEQGIDWSGFYVGAHGGYGWGSADAEFTSGDAGAVDLDPDNAFVGGQIGYNYVFGNGLLVGVEADYSFGKLSDSANVTTFFPTTVTTEVDKMASVRGRLGYAMGSFLPYVTAGWAWADVERSSSFVFFDTPFNESDSLSFNGWTAGVGLEYAVTSDWSIGAEYRYTDFGSETFDFTFVDSEVDLDLHTVRFAVNYRF